MARQSYGSLTVFVTPRSLGMPPTCLIRKGVLVANVWAREKEVRRLVHRSILDRLHARRVTLSDRIIEFCRAVLTRIGEALR